MEIGLLVLLGGLVSASGWVLAWRARGESNKASDRGRIAEARADAEHARAFDAEARRAAAESRAKTVAIENETLRAAVSREQAEKRELLERLAQLRVAVGDELFDSTIDRLYKNSHRNGNGSGAGTGGDQSAVSADPASAPTKTDPSR